MTKTKCLFGNSLYSFVLKIFVESVLKYTYTLKIWDFKKLYIEIKS